MRWTQWLSRYVQIGASTALLGALLGCSHSPDLPADTVMDPVRNADLGPRAANPMDGQYADSRQSAPPPMVFPGPEGGDLAPAPVPSRQAGADLRTAASVGGTTGQVNSGIEINFEGADIQTVAKSLLGDTLGMSFVIDPRVQGSVTLASTLPVARKDVLPIFESVLRMSNAAVIRDGNLVRIVPIPEASGSGNVTLGAGTPGYGVSIVPLRYTSAATIGKTAENFLARPGAVRIDQARNLLLIQGTSAERQSAVDMIAAFDVEWMRNQSVGIYPLKSTSPETMIRELEKVFDSADGGQGQGVIRFQPISRMNAVLALAKNPKLLERTTQWVSRLDRSDVSGTTVRVYRLKYGSAQRIAKVLNDIFVGRGSNGTSGQTPASQIAPGSNAAQSKLDSLGGGSLGSGSAAGGNGASGGGASTGGQSGAGGAGATLASNFEGFADAKADDQSKDADAGGAGASGSLRGVFQNVRITADTVDNSVVIYSNQEDYDVIERSMRELDRPPLQVAVDATVAEVTLTNDLQYGVQHFFTSNSVGLGNDKGSSMFSNSASAGTTTTTDPTTGVSSTVASAFLQRVLPGYNLVLGPEAQPNVILSALSTLTSVKVLSAPSLVVMDNQPAVLQVGQEIPVSTGSATVLTGQNTVVNTIQMTDVGVILKVWPHVRPNGMIQLEIDQEISNVVNQSTTPNLTPTLSQRRVHSTVAIASGQTVLLGGLISEEKDDNSQGIPGLREIQYLGDLLGNTSHNKTRTEIIVFVRPRMIRNSTDASSVAQEFRDRLESMRNVGSVITGTDVHAKQQ